MAKLFEYTLPKLEPLLNELGEARAKKIVSKLCEHGKAMIEKYGIDGSKEHLEGLFTFLPDFGENLRRKGGVEEVIETYRQYEEEGIVNDLYLDHKLFGKIREKFTDEHDNYWLEFDYSANDQDLQLIRKAKNIYKLNLNGTNVSDLSLLSGLLGLQELHMRSTEVRDLGPLNGLTGLVVLDIQNNQIRDYSPLSGLVNLHDLFASMPENHDLSPLKALKELRVLAMDRSEISDLSALSDLTNLEIISLVGTNVSDLTPIMGLTNLRQLYLNETQVSEAQIKAIKKAIPGLKVYQ
jgi:hypothetical protein